MENKNNRPPFLDKGIDIKRLINKAEIVFDINITERSRKSEIVSVRAAMMAALARKMEFGWSEIGRAFNLDHATVMHHVSRHDQNYKMIGEWSARYTAWYDRFVEFLDRDCISEQEYIFANAMIGRLPKTIHKRDVTYIRI